MPPAKTTRGSHFRPNVEVLEERSLLAATVTGRVFEDFNANGLFDTNTTQVNASGQGTVSAAVDRAVAGVTVTAVDAKGRVRGTTVTTGTMTATGNFTLKVTGSGPYRIQFTLPAGFTSGPNGAGPLGSKTSVQFVPNRVSHNINLGLVRQGNFSQDFPDLVTNLYVQGSIDNADNANTAVVINVPYNAGTQSSDDELDNYTNPTAHTLAIPKSAVGTVWGLGYNPFNETIYAAAFMKKFTGFGPSATPGEFTTGGIYQMGTSGTTATLFADLNAIFGADTAGADPHDYSAATGIDRPDGITNDNGDVGWDAVGKVSLGGLDVSADGQRVYVMNLADRSLYALPTTGPLDATTVYRQSLLTLLDSLEEIGVTGITADNLLGDLRPFAVTVFNGSIYVGAVNSAETTQSRDDLRAYVFRVTDTGTSLIFDPTPVLQFDLDYARGAANIDIFGGAVTSANWLPWSPVRQNIDASSTTNVIYPQPMLTGLAFDATGNMVLGFRDRAGDQSGTFADPADPEAFPGRGITAGDILRASANGTATLWTIENNGSDGTNTTAGAGNNEGPGAGEFYFQDTYDFAGTVHHEIGLGGVAQIPGFPDVLTTSLDPAYGVVADTNFLTNGFNAGGVTWMNNTTGVNVKAYQAFKNLDTTGFFAKANGMGDLVAIRTLAPTEVGNRVWFDANRNGIQDPNERALRGVRVNLFSDTGALLASALTDANGNYIFSNDARRGGETTASNVYALAGFTNDTPFVVRLDPSNFARGGPLANLRVTTALAGPNRAIDSKGILDNGLVSIFFGLGGRGANDHTLDFGFWQVSKRALFR